MVRHGDMEENVSGCFFSEHSVVSLIAARTGRVKLSLLRCSMYVGLLLT